MCHLWGESEAVTGINALGDWETAVPLHWETGLLYHYTGRLVALHWETSLLYHYTGRLVCYTITEGDWWSAVPLQWETGLLVTSGYKSRFLGGAY